MVDEARRVLIKQFTKEREEAVEKARAEEREKIKSKERPVRENRATQIERRIEKGSRGFIRQRLLQQKFARSVNPRKRRQDLRALRLQLAIIRAGQQGSTQQSIQQQLAAQKINDFLNTSQGVGWSGHYAALDLEKEISGMGANSVNLEGDKTASQIGVEALNISKIQHLNPSAAVSNETMAHARFVDMMPNLNIDREVSLSSRLGDFTAMFSDVRPISQVPAQPSKKRRK